MKLDWDIAARPENSINVADMNTTRIDQCFAELKSQGRAALMTFITAGDPDSVTSLAILRALPAAGADVIELGMPFTDPMADGPAIQMSSQRALKAGQTLKKTLDMVRDFRAGDNATATTIRFTSMEWVNFSRTRRRPVSTG